MAKILSPAEIDRELRDLPGWTVSDAKLHKEYEFESFLGALGFMTKASAEIEKMNHHPEWLNVYNRVVVNLTTHDAGGITENDVRLARILDSSIA